jgi:hypothetical protein
LSLTAAFSLNTMCFAIVFIEFEYIALLLLPDQENDNAKRLFSSQGDTPG